jgi:hypothetical protein
MRSACWLLALAPCFVSASLTPAESQLQPPAGYQLLTDPQGTGGHLVATRQGSGSAPRCSGSRSRK